MAAIVAYVLIETEVGRLRAVGEAVRNFEHPDARLLMSSMVTGPYDVIAVLEADDLDRLGTAVMESLAVIPGVKRTTTCLTIPL